jgi:Pterin 4 alpha carbinolamine dehydratase
MVPRYDGTRQKLGEDGAYRTSETTQCSLQNPVGLFFVQVFGTRRSWLVLIEQQSWLQSQNGRRSAPRHPVMTEVVHAPVVLWFSQVVGRDAIQRTFVFRDFNEAFSFMTRTALAAEQVSRKLGDLYPSP